jgi:hypothetical protein
LANGSAVASERVRDELPQGDALGHKVAGNQPAAAAASAGDAAAEPLDQFDVQAVLVQLNVCPSLTESTTTEPAP